MKQSNIVAFVLPESGQIYDPEPNRIIHGRVKNAGDGKYVVHLDDGRVVRAAIARGCLTLPVPGDVVLVYAGHGKVAYVLTVLESQQTVTTLETDRELVINAPRLRVEARESLHLSAPDVDVSGVRGRLGFLTLTLAASVLEARIESIGAFVENIRIKAGSLIQFLGNSLRRVRGMDAVRAGNMNVRIEDAYKLKTGSADLRSQGTLSVDGERVNIG